MTGTPNDLDTTRHEPPTGTADIFISPGESNRKASNGRNRRIGRILTESFLAAAVGGIITLLVWHQVTPNSASNAQSKLNLEAKSEATTPGKLDELTEAKTEAKTTEKAEVKPEVTAKFESLDDFMVEPTTPGAKASQSELNSLEIPKESKDISDKVVAGSNSKATNPMNESMDDSLDVPMDDSMADSLDEPMDNPSDPTIARISTEPKIINKANGQSVNAKDLYNVPILKADAKVNADAKKKYITLAPLASKTVPVTDVEPKAEPKVEAKVISITKVDPKINAIALPKIEAKVEPKVEAKIESKVLTTAEAKAEPTTEKTPMPTAKVQFGFPPIQDDGQFIVTAGSFASQQGAEALQKKLSEAGIPIRLRKSMSNNKTMYHLLTGPFASTEIATRAVMAIKERTGVESRYLTMRGPNPKTSENRQAVASKQPVAVSTDTAIKKAPAKADAVVKAPQENKKAAIATPKGNFVATAGSFSNAANANQLRQRIEKQGVAAYTKMALVNGKEYTHVIMGPFTSQKEADKTLESIQKQIGVMAKATLVQ